MGYFGLGLGLGSGSALRSDATALTVLGIPSPNSANGRTATLTAHRITLASYLSLSNATSLLLIRDAYESVVLASFFSLLLEYLAGPAHPPPEHPPKSNKRRKNARDEEQERLDTESTFPTGTESIAHPLNKAERATIVYKVFYRVPMYPLKLTGQLLSIIYDSAPIYFIPALLIKKCVWNTAQSQVVTIVSVSVTVAMYCLIQLYTTISKELKPYSPLLKLFAVKAVVFLTFWQSALLSGLASLDIIKDTEYMTAEDIVVGFSALLQTFEMMCFALLHVKAFSYVPYKRIARIRTETRSSPTPERNRARDPDMPPLLTPPNEERVGSRPDRPVPAPPKQQLINLFQAFTFTDTFRDLRAGVLYFFGRGASREADDVCRREERFREVFGRERVQRSFMKVSGYKGLPQDEGRAIPGVQYSPLPTPPKEDYDDAPQLSLSKTRESEDTVRDGQLEYLDRRLPGAEME
ncbi:Transmembrane protein 184 homolog DDB_G0284525 [Rhizoctonia solani AG-1 IB]|uniref:Transmembrane protein 184 homolog DDB_G0284525 n=1 Tax=Thanatephorus cucumeris (strain AG1-IB / isolate 7/3/14) TaxID=1108050 RepID=M5BVQ0_THACB|nr:Transmembrane protein 184 homolog DDB_G0284525 [Rhizoctonia solani AG-1 IB]